MWASLALAVLQSPPHEGVGVLAPPPGPWFVLSDGKGQELACWRSCEVRRVAVSSGLWGTDSGWEGEEAGLGEGGTGRLVVQSQGCASQGQELEE